MKIDCDKTLSIHKTFLCFLTDANGSENSSSFLELVVGWGPASLATAASQRAQSELSLPSIISGLGKALGISRLSKMSTLTELGVAPSLEDFCSGCLLELFMAISPNLWLSVVPLMSDAKPLPAAVPYVPPEPEIVGAGVLDRHRMI